MAESAGFNFQSQNLSVKFTKLADYSLVKVDSVR